MQLGAGSLKAFKQAVCRVSCGCSKQKVNHTRYECFADVAVSLLQDLLPAHVPIICVSKGLEVGTGAMMSELIPEALCRKQPAVFLSGPSFAKEVMDQCPTGVVAACKVWLTPHV